MENNSTTIKKLISTNQVYHDPKTQNLDECIVWTVEQSNRVKKPCVVRFNNFLVWSDGCSHQVVEGMNSLQEGGFLSLMDPAATEEFFLVSMQKFAHEFPDATGPMDTKLLQPGTVQSINAIGASQLKIVCFSTSCGWFDMVLLTYQRGQVDSIAHYAQTKNGILTHSGDKKKDNTNLHFGTLSSKIPPGTYVIVCFYGFTKAKLLSFTGKGKDPTVTIFFGSSCNPLVIPCVLTQQTVGDATFLPVVSMKQNRDGTMSIFAPLSAQGVLDVNTGELPPPVLRSIGDLVHQHEQQEIKESSTTPRENKEKRAALLENKEKSAELPENKASSVAPDEPVINHFTQPRLPFNNSIPSGALPTCNDDKKMFSLFCVVGGMTGIDCPHASPTAVAALKQPGVAVVHVSQSEKWNSYTSASHLQLLNAVIIFHCSSTTDRKTVPFLAAGPFAVCCYEQNGVYTLALPSGCPLPATGMVTHSTGFHQDQETKVKRGYVIVHGLEYPYEPTEGTVALLERKGVITVLKLPVSTNWYQSYLPGVKEGDDVTRKFTPASIHELNKSSQLSVGAVLDFSRVVEDMRTMNLPRFTDTENPLVMLGDQLGTVDEAVCTVMAMDYEAVLAHHGDIALLVTQLGYVLDPAAMTITRSRILEWLAGLQNGGQYLEEARRQLAYLTLTDPQQTKAKLVKQQVTQAKVRSNCPVIKSLLHVLEDAASLKGVYSEVQLKTRTVQARSVQEAQRKCAIANNVELAKNTDPAQFLENNTQEHGSVMLNVGEAVLKGLMLMAHKIHLCSITEFTQLAGLAHLNGRMPLLDSDTASAVITYSGHQHGLAGQGKPLACAQGVSRGEETKSCLPIPLLAVLAVITQPEEVRWDQMANTVPVALYRVFARDMLASSHIARGIPLKSQDVGVGYVFLELLLQAGESIQRAGMGNRRPDVKDRDDGMCLVLRCVVGHILATMASTATILCPAYKLVYLGGCIPRLSPCDWQFMLRLYDLLPYAYPGCAVLGVAQANLESFLAKSVWGALASVIKPMQQSVNAVERAKQKQFTVSKGYELQWQGLVTTLLDRLVAGLTTDQRDQLKSGRFESTEETRQIGQSLCNAHAQITGRFGKNAFDKASNSSKRFLVFAEALQAGEVTARMFQDALFYAKACLFKRAAIFKKHKLGQIVPELAMPLSMQETGKKHMEDMCDLFNSVLAGWKLHPQNSEVFEEKKLDARMLGDAELKRKPWSLEGYPGVVLPTGQTGVPPSVSNMLQADEEEYQKLQNFAKAVYTGVDAYETAEEIETSEATLEEILQRTVGSGLAVQCLKESLEETLQRVFIAMGTTKDGERGIGHEEFMLLVRALSLTSSVVQECVRGCLRHWNDYPKAAETTLVVIRRARAIQIEDV